MTSNTKVANVFYWLLMLIFVIGLVVYAFFGIYSRYWSDDWCYNADYRTLGFWGTLAGYNYITTYASNRLSLTFFSMMLETTGLFGVQILPLIIVSMWVGGIYLNLLCLKKWLLFHAEKLHLLMFSVAITYISLYLAPNQFQVLYWRTGILPYTAPLIGSLYVSGIIFSKFNQTERSKNLISHLGIFLLVLISSLFSEAGWAYLFSLLVLILFFFVIFRFNLAIKSSIPFVLTALLGSAAALIILLLSPANWLRLSGYPNPYPFYMIPVLSVKFALDFAFYSTKGFILPYTTVFIMFFGLSVISGQVKPKPLKQILFICVVILFSAILLMAANQAPSTYIEKGPPHPRALIISCFIWTSALASVSFVLGTSFSLKLDKSIFFIFLMLFFAFFYFGRTVILEMQQWKIFSERAQIWDYRDAQIKQAVIDEQQSVYVQAIDGASMDHTRDLKEKPQFWINACAAKYYGIEEIYAGAQK